MCQSMQKSFGDASEMCQKSAESDTQGHTLTILNSWTEPKPKRVIFYADNSATITKIFEGAHGKAQHHSKAFRKVISSILCNNPETKIAISWCPGHSGVCRKMVQYVNCLQRQN